MLIEKEYAELRETAVRFSQSVLAPEAEDIDQKGRIPRSIMDQLSENGFMGIFIPEEYGGSGMNYISYAIMVEELARACASSSVFVAAHLSLATWPILQFGNSEQKKKYLPKLASGEWVGCFCLSEPNAGSDAASLTTRAIKKGNSYELTGVKNWVTNGKEAGLAIVFAKTEKTPDHKGISAFIVETDREGWKVQKEEQKLGIKGSSTTQIVLDKVNVPAENLLWQERKGFRLALATLDGGRIGIAAQALGIARAAFEYAKKYTAERVQFGKPLSSLQGVQFILADMSTKIAASRLFVQHASLLKDTGEAYGKEASQAKLFASEAAMWITTKGIQLLGGNGYTCEYPLERNFRDAKITEIYEGTSEIQRLVIAANELKDI